MTEHAFSYACDFITKAQKEFIQAMILETGDGELSYIVAPWSNDQERQAFIRTLIRYLKTVNATRYVFLSEAWLVTYDPEDSDAVDGVPRVRPHAHPRRREVLFACGVAKDGAHHHISAEIKTNDAGKRCIDERNPDMADMTEIGGQLTKLFEPDPWGDDFCTDETTLRRI